MEVFGISIPLAKSGIHIKKENEGKFTASAQRAGESVQEHAHNVVNNPNATPLQKKRAQFAINAKKWKHEDGAKIHKPFGHTPVATANWSRFAKKRTRLNDVIKGQDGVPGLYPDMGYPNDPNSEQYNHYYKWLTNWLNNRQEQFKQNYKDATNIPGLWNPTASDDPIINSLQEKLAAGNLSEQLKKAGNTPIYNLNSSEGRKLIDEKYKNARTRDKRRVTDQLNGSLFGAPLGTHIPQTGDIILGTNIGEDPTAILHELTHSLNNWLGRNKTYNTKPQTEAIKALGEPQLRKGQQPLQYTDNPDEIYSRLMQLRYKNNVKPNQIITNEDLKEWRKKNNDGILHHTGSKLKYDNDILERYTDEYILKLLNGIASNDSKPKNTNLYV